MNHIRALYVFVLAGTAFLASDRMALAQNAATAQVAAPASQQRVATYMKIEGMPGTVTEKSHQGCIEIVSFSWGVGRGITSPARSAADREGSAPSVSEIVVTKPHDASSPKLMLAATTAKHLDQVVIEFVRPDKQVVYQVKLIDVLVSRYAESSGGDRPTESMSFNFGKIQWTYSKLNADGGAGPPQSPPAGWDIAKVTKA